jgi:hypothetical protein
MAEFRDGSCGLPSPLGQIFWRDWNMASTCCCSSLASFSRLSQYSAAHCRNVKSAVLFLSVFIIDSHGVQYDLQCGGSCAPGEGRSAPEFFGSHSWMYCTYVGTYTLEPRSNCTKGYLVQYIRYTLQYDECIGG